MIIQYPSNKLPLPKISNYSYTRGNSLIRTRMEAGNVKQRRRYTHELSHSNVSFLFNELQLALFEGFFIYELDYGVAWFEMSFKTGLGLTKQKCRFIGDYNVQALNNSHYQIKTTLEIISLSKIDRGVYDFLLKEDFDGDSIYDLNNNMRKIEKLVGDIVYEIREKDYDI